MKFPGTQRYTWVERNTVREVSCLRISCINPGQCSNQDHSMLKAALKPLGHPTSTRLKLMYKDLRFNSKLRATLEPLDHLTSTRLKLMYKDLRFNSKLRAALEPLGHPNSTRLKLMYKDLRFNSNGMCHPMKPSYNTSTASRV